MSDKLHNMGARLATGFFRSNPIDSLLNISGLMPLDIKRRESSMILVAKLARNDMASSVILNFALKPLIQKNKIDLDTIVSTKTSNIPPWILEININTSMTECPKSPTSQNIYKQNSTKFYHITLIVPKYTRTHLKPILMCASP